MLRKQLCELRSPHGEVAGSAGDSRTFGKTEGTGGRVKKRASVYRTALASGGRACTPSPGHPNIRRTRLVSLGQVTAVTSARAGARVPSENGENDGKAMKLILKIAAGGALAVVVIVAGLLAVGAYETRPGSAYDQHQKQVQADMDKQDAKYCQQMKADDSLNCNPDGTVKPGSPKAPH